MWNRDLESWHGGLYPLAICRRRGPGLWPWEAYTVFLGLLIRLKIPFHQGFSNLAQVYVSVF